MTTANDLVSGTLRLISSLAPGEGIPGLESDAALSALNLMLEAWSGSNLMAPFRTLEGFTMAVGQPSYTIGQSGSPNFNTVRPDYATSVFRRDGNGQDRPLDPLTKEQYNAIPDKTTPGDPQWYYYDTQYPNGVLHLYPAPYLADTLFVESLKPLVQFSTLSATVDLPGEYKEPIKFLLAERLAPEYGFAITPDIRKLIEDSRKMVLRKNLKPKVATFDAALLPPPVVTITSG